jgi:hypothetical protein
MVEDWISGWLVVALFAGVVMAVTSAAYAAAGFHVSSPGDDRRRDELTAVLEEMGRRAAAVERMLAQLKAVQAAAHMVLDDYEANRPRYRGLINGSRAGLDLRRPVASGPDKRR